MTTASLSDILTATKNIVTALNNAARQYFLIAGSQVAEGMTAPTLVATGHGRVCVVSVCAAGSAPVGFFDSADVSSTPVSRALCAVPAAIGVYRIDLPFSFGLVAVPGAGQIITVSYSLGDGSGGV
jgi:hypothetical protein